MSVAVSQNREKVFSIFGDTFYDDVDYIKDCLEKDGSIKTVYVGSKTKKKHSDYLDIEDCLEGMVNQAYDDGDEWAENYCDTLNKLSKEHKEKMETLLLEYMDKNIEQPSFFIVEDAKEISVDEFRELLKRQ